LHWEQAVLISTTVTGTTDFICTRNHLNFAVKPRFGAL